MFAVEPLRLHGAQEELAAIGARPCIGHGQNAWPSMLELEVLIGELVAVDGAAARAVTAREVATLDHKVADHAMEFAVLVTKSILARAELLEVLAGLRHVITVQSDDNAAFGLATNFDVEEDLVLHGCWVVLRGVRGNRALNKAALELSMRLQIARYLGIG